MKYSEQQRSNAVQAYTEHGAAEASRRLKIPARTIRDWANKAGVVAVADTKKTETARATQERRITEKRAKLRELMLDQAIDLMGRMNQPHIDFKGTGAQQVEYPTPRSGDVRNYAVAVAVLVDKFRLESGDPTAHQHYTTDDQLDKDLRTLLSQFDDTPADTS